MKTSKNRKLIRTILIVVLLFIIASLFAISYALFTDKYSSSSNLKFGTIEIGSNKDEWFSSVQTKNLILKPGDVAVNGVSFGLGKDKSNKTSQSFYVRAKCVIKTNSTNTEIVKIKDSLNTALASSLGSADSYKWSAEDEGYFYLLGADNLPLAISDVNATYYFIKSEGLAVSSNLEIDGTKVNSDTITITVSIEAIQVSNLTAESGGTLQNKIKTELDALVGNK